MLFLCIVYLLSSSKRKCKLSKIFHYEKIKRYCLQGHLPGVDDIFAIANDAKYVEKHFTTDRKLPGRDNKFKILPKDLKLITEFRDTVAYMNLNKGLNVQKCEMDIYKRYRGRWSGKDKFSVIIRCKNEERWIGHCIQSIIDHLNSPEILIVDNNSNDDTIHVIKHFIKDTKLLANKNYTDIKIFNINDYTRKSLNLGVKKAKNDNILIMSAHCILKKISTKKIINDLKSIGLFLEIKYHLERKKILRDISGAIL